MIIWEASRLWLPPFVSYVIGNLRAKFSTIIVLLF